LSSGIDTRISRTVSRSWPCRDTLSLPAGSRFAFVNTGDTDAESLLVVRGDAPKRPQFSPELVRQAAARDLAVDAGGRLARLSVLPPSLAA
jgi:hypothetical protein